MVQTFSDSDDLAFDDPEAFGGSQLDSAYEQDQSKPFRGILFGLLIVIPLWIVIGVALYFFL